IHTPPPPTSTLFPYTTLFRSTSFISFRFAVAAVMTGAFSLTQASLQFLLVATGGICVGFAIGWLATQVQKRLDDPPVQTMFSLRSEEHTSELQSRFDLVCRLL